MRSKIRFKANVLAYTWTTQEIAAAPWDKNEGPREAYIKPTEAFGHASFCIHGYTKQPDRADKSEGGSRFRLGGSRRLWVGRGRVAAARH